MGRRRSGGGWAGPLGKIHQQKVAERDARRAIQDAGSAEDRERIEAAQQGREAFADSGRWGHLDMHGKSIEPAPTPTPIKKLQIQDTPKPTTTKTITKKKKATPTTKAPTSNVAGSLGSVSGGSVRL